MAKQSVHVLPAWRCGAHGCKGGLSIIPKRKPQVTAALAGEGLSATRSLYRGPGCPKASFSCSQECCLERPSHGGWFSIICCSASFWTPPSHYDTAVAAENNLQYARINPSNSETTAAELFFTLLRAVCRVTAEGLS